MGLLTQINPNQFSVTLTTATDAQHAGDVLAATQEIVDFFPSANVPAFITGIQVTDAADQGGQIDLLFMNANTDIGTEGAANAISDAEALTILCWADINAADWKDWGANRSAFLKASDANFFTPGWIKGASTSLYIGAIDQSGSTYAGGTDITVVISVEYP